MYMQRLFRLPSWLCAFREPWLDREFVFHPLLPFPPNTFLGSRLLPSQCKESFRLKFVRRSAVCEGIGTAKTVALLGLLIRLVPIRQSRLFQFPKKNTKQYLKTYLRGNINTMFYTSVACTIRRFVSDVSESLEELILEPNWSNCNKYLTRFYKI